MPFQPEDGGSAVEAVPGAISFQEQGAPNKVRLAVGSARPADRLQVLRSFYPDAVEVNGNFVYTDEEGRKRLFNPKGLDTGDVFGSGREIAEMAGGAAGSLAGGALGAPAGPFGVGAGSFAGGVAGATAADAGVDLLQQFLGGNEPSQPFEERLTDDVMANTAGEAVGTAGSLAMRGAAGTILGRGGAPAAASAIEASERQGLPPLTPGMTGGRVAGTLENAAEAANLTSTARRRSMDVHQSIEDKLIGAVPTAPVNANPSAAARAGGEALARGAGRRVEHFRKVRNKADENFYNTVPAGTTFSINNLINFTNGLKAEFARAPNTMSPAYKKTLEYLDGVIADANLHGGQLPIDLMRKFRTYLGEVTFNGKIAEQAGLNEQLLKKAYAATREDLYDAAKTVGPDAVNKLQIQDKIVQRYSQARPGEEATEDTLVRLLNSKKPEQVFAAVKSGNLANMPEVLRGVSKADRKVLARAVLDTMMQQRDGTIDLLKFRREYEAMSPKARKMLFGGSIDLAALDDLVKVLGFVRDKAGTKNFSNTANTAATLGSTGSMLGGLYAALSGNTGTAVTMLGIPITAMVMDAVLTNKTASRWFNESIKRMANGGKAFPMPPPVAEILKQATTKLGGREAVRMGQE